MKNEHSEEVPVCQEVVSGGTLTDDLDEMRVQGHGPDQPTLLVLATELETQVLLRIRMQLFSVEDMSAL